MKNLVIRALSGAVYVALIVLSIVLIPSSPAMFLAVFALVTAVAMWEITRMTVEGDVRAPLIDLMDIIGGLAVFLSFFLMHVGGESRSIWMLPMLLYFVLRLTAQLAMPEVNALHSLQRSFMCVAYVALPLGLLSSIVAVGSSSGGNGSAILLAVFIFLWCSDTGAYLVGSAIGKHRLAERISPKKSWEGFWGGVALAVLASVVISQFFASWFGDLGLVFWIGLALVVSVVGTLGDLVESLLKRTVGVKDSSKLIAGHGGVLDRIDSLLLAAPAALIYLYILKYYI